MFKSKRLLTAAIILLPIVFAGIGIYEWRLYLPELPVEGVTRKQAHETISRRTNSLEWLTTENGYNWYLYQGNQAGGGEELIERLRAQGLTFIEQMGAGYMFAADDSQEQIIVESQMWTGKYIIYQVPERIKL